MRIFGVVYDWYTCVYKRIWQCVRVWERDSLNAISYDSLNFSRVIDIAGYEVDRHVVFPRLFQFLTYILSDCSTVPCSWDPLRSVSGFIANSSQYWTRREQKEQMPLQRGMTLSFEFISAKGYKPLLILNETFRKPKYQCVTANKSFSKHSSFRVADDRNQKGYINENGIIISVKLSRKRCLF